MAPSLYPLKPLGYSEMLSGLCRLKVMMSSRDDTNTFHLGNKLTCKSVSFGCWTRVLIMLPH